MSRTPEGGTNTPQSLSVQHAPNVPLWRMAPPSAISHCWLPFMRWQRPMWTSPGKVLVHASRHWLSGVRISPSRLIIHAWLPPWPWHVYTPAVPPFLWPILSRHVLASALTSSPEWRTCSSLQTVAKKHEEERLSRRGGACGKKRKTRSACQGQGCHVLWDENVRHNIVQVPLEGLALEPLSQFHAGANVARLDMVDCRRAAWS